MMNKLLSYTLILHRPPTLMERFLHKMEAVKPLLHLVISCSCIELHQRSASYMATCVLHIWQVGALSLPRYGAHYGLWHTGWSTPAVMWSIWAIQVLSVQYFAPDTIKYIFPLIFCTSYNSMLSSKFGLWILSLVRLHDLTHRMATVVQAEIDGEKKDNVNLIVDLL